MGGHLTWEMRQLLIIQVHLTVEPDENVNVLGQAFIAAVKVMLGTSKSVLRHVSLRLAIWDSSFLLTQTGGEIRCWLSSLCHFMETQIEQLPPAFNLD